MKNFFLTRATREKLLLILFVGLGALVWLSSVGKRGRAFRTDWKGNAEELTGQAQLLGNRASIEKQAEAAVKHLDPAKTIDATRLNSVLNTIVSQVGVSADIESPSTRSIDQFAIHTTNIFFKRATDVGTVLRLNDEIAKQSPYLVLEACNLKADKTGLVIATLKVSAPEIRR